MRSTYNGETVYYKVAWQVGNLTLTNGDGYKKDKDYIFRFDYKATVSNGIQGLIYSYDDEKWPPLSSSSAIRCGAGYVQGITCSMDDGAEANYKSNGSKSWNSMVITDDLGDNKAAIEITAWSIPEYGGDVAYVCVAGAGGTWGCTKPTGDDIKHSQIQICFYNDPGSVTPTNPGCKECIMKRKTDDDTEYSSYWCLNNNQTCYLHGAHPTDCPGSDHCVAAGAVNCKYSDCDSDTNWKESYYLKYDPDEFAGIF